MNTNENETTQRNKVKSVEGFLRRWGLENLRANHVQAKCAAVSSGMPATAARLGDCGGALVNELGVVAVEVDRIEVAAAEVDGVEGAAARIDGVQGARGSSDTGLRGRGVPEFRVVCSHSCLFLAGCTGGVARIGVVCL